MLISNQIPLFNLSIVTSNEERNSSCRNLIVMRNSVAWLHLVGWWYNSTYHTSTKVTLFQAFYDYEPPKWKEFTIIEIKFPTIKDQLKETHKVFQEIKEI